MPEQTEPAEINHATVTNVYATSDSLMPPFELKSAKLEGEFVDQASPRSPAVRIVHHGGPVENARIYIDGKDVSNHVVAVELAMEGCDDAVYPTITFADCELDVTGEIIPRPRTGLEGDAYVKVTARPAAEFDVTAYRDGALIVPRERFFWPVLIGGLIVDAVAAGLAWWSWDRSGWFATLVFVLSVMGGVAWTFGVLGGFVGYGRAMAAVEPAGPEDVEDEQ